MVIQSLLTNEKPPALLVVTPPSVIDHHFSISLPLSTPTHPTSWPAPSRSPTTALASVPKPSSSTRPSQPLSLTHLQSHHRPSRSPPVHPASGQHSATWDKQSCTSHQRLHSDRSSSTTRVCNIWTSLNSTGATTPTTTWTSPSTIACHCLHRSRRNWKTANASVHPLRTIVSPSSPTSFPPALCKPLVKHTLINNL